MTVNRLLVANRGEIARRVFATCRRLGIETVAVHSDADAGLPFVAEADFAVRLPGDAPADTYLRVDLVLDAARRSGADAVHPGYGFLSENADLARAVLGAGLVWVGPPPEAIEAMGSKIGAKELMRAAGVPVLEAPAQPTEADLPLLVKASAGGGGRGMRIVRSLAALAGEVAAAEAEAASAFGDGTVFVEPYVERGRHVEVQVWGDHSGTHVSVLGARDCTVQRRHQKVVEESPPHRVSEVTLEAMYDAARAAAAAIGYVGAGTVEFLLDAGSDDDLAAGTGEPGRFWFLEMNTRLQVEHPVTELVHGVDLVELQLTAADDPTVLEVEAGDPRGHAVEVRLYAEDAGFTPQSGRLVSFDLPGEAEFGPLARAGVRVDSGFAAGTDVSTHYDAMLAKLVSWAPTREGATRQLVAALRRARIHGVTTNRDQLVDILTDPAFGDMSVTTTWLESRGPSGGADPAVPPSPAPLAGRGPVVAAALALAADDAARRTVQQGIPAGWRNVVSQPQRTCFEGHEPVEWWGTRDGLAVEGATVLSATPDHVRLEVDGVATSYAVTLVRTPGTRDAHVDGAGGSLSLREVPRFTDPAEAVASGSLLAPMPGTVVTVTAAVGDVVGAGQPVLVLEAMKMQHQVVAPTAGTVTAVHVEPGAQVAAGEVLAVVEEEEE